MNAKAILLAIGIALSPVATVHAAAPPARGATDVPILTGGVGAGERDRLLQEAKDYNVRLVFTLGTGHYLADVPFHIARGGKVIAEGVAEGPWTFVKLPPGNYTVSATYEGKRQTRQVSVPKTGQRRIAFAWPAPPRVAEQPQR